MHNDHIEYEKQPIIVQSSPKGSGAIALIRASGDNVFQLSFMAIQLSSKKSIVDIATHTISHGNIIDSFGDIIDDVMIIKMFGPRTFTGEDTLEITCHNNTLIINNILNRFYECGFRPADPGEFTRRAVINEKIVLSQAEAIHELIFASNQYAINNALAQLKGSVLSFVEEFDKDLIKIAAWCQASFEFLDEERDFREVIISLIEHLMQKIKTCIDARDIQKQINDGIRVALVGDANAGKSSIFNMILGHNRAIVTDIPGTTRDVIEEAIYYKNIKITLIDTAGIRNTKNVIEQEGIKRSYKEINNADIIFFVIDPLSKKIENNIMHVYKTMTQQEKESIVIFNKSDCYDNNVINYINDCVIKYDIKKYYTFSTLNNELISIILKPMHDTIDSMLVNNNVKFVINERNYALLINIYNQLKKIHDAIKNKKNMHYELLLISIHDIQQMLLGISGKNVSDKSFDFVFQQFCIGK